MDLLKKHFSRKPKTPIYHYTSQKGLIGILQNQEIWASKIQYLNDTTEFSYAFDLLRNRLSTKYSGEDGKFIKNVLGSISKSEYLNIFAASFSEEADLLSQWRAYCPESGGYNIGFKFEDLKNILKKQNFSIVPCEYRESKQLDLIDELIETSLIEFKDTGKTGWEDHYSKFKSKFIRLAPTLKHPSFKEEKEWRVVSRPVSYNNSKVSFRTGESMIVPFYKFPLSEPQENFSFHEIYIGPTPHKKLAEDSVIGLLFDTNHFPAIAQPDKVLISDIPYRTW